MALWARFPLRRILLFIGLLLLLLVGYKTIRTGFYVWSAYQEGMVLLSLRDELAQSDSAQLDTLHERLPQTEESLAKIASAVGGIEREMRFFAPLLHRLGWVSKVGGTLAATPDLLIGARELSALAGEGIVLMQPVLDAVQDGSQSPTEALLDTLPTMEVELEQLAQHAEIANDALGPLLASDLHPSIADSFAAAQPLLPLLAPILRMGSSLPALVGVGEARTYLLLIQNNHELRATGGLISGLGKLTLEDAQIADLAFSDSYATQRKDVEYPNAPDPMRRYMGLHLMLLRDTNWSPDLATSAQTASAIYAQDTGIQIDGVVTVDLHAVEQMITGLGALKIPGSEEPITGETVVDQIKQFWNKPLGTEDTLEEAGLGKWWSQRKKFMPALAFAALERVESGDIDKRALFQAALNALNRRSVQIWVADPKVSLQLAKLGWDGGLHPPQEGDFVALVDSNLGYNKVDSIIQRSMEYAVAWPNGAEEPAIATLKMTYTHPLPVKEHECNVYPRYGKEYDDLTKRCYFNYIRLYVPAGSELLSVDGAEPESVSTRRGEKSTQIFSAYIIVKDGTEETVTFVYELPPRITPDSYRLLLQRQSGTEPLPLTVTIDGKTQSTVVVDGQYSWEER